MLKPNILIVDDVEFNIIALIALLENEGYNIYKANSGAECLNILLKEKINIILMDVQMPDMDGFETANYIRKSHKTKTIPIIFVTAARQTETFSLRGYESGAIDIIYKPINEHILKHKLAIFRDLINKEQQLQKQIEELETLNKMNEEMRKKIEYMALKDYLTDLDNRRSVDDNLERFYKDSFRNKTPLSVLMLDIDNFKHYNDYFGHTEGDEVLKSIAKILKVSATRPIDCVGRFGGEEFVIILPNTDEKGAMKVANTVIEKTRSTKIKHAPTSPKEIITLSIGVASVIPKDNDNYIEFLSLADEALYTAKNSGKDKSVLHQE